MTRPYRATRFVLAGLVLAISVWTAWQWNARIAGITLHYRSVPRSDLYQAVPLRRHGSARRLESLLYHNATTGPAAIRFRFGSIDRNIDGIRFHLGNHAALEPIDRITVDTGFLLWQPALVEWPLQEFAEAIRHTSGIERVEVRDGILVIDESDRLAYIEVAFDPVLARASAPAFTVIACMLAWVGVGTLAALVIVFAPGRGMGLPVPAAPRAVMFQRWRADRLPPIDRRLVPWAGAGAALFTILNVVRIWPNLRHPGLYVEDSWEYFNAFYGADTPLLAGTFHSHGYFVLLTKLWAWLSAFTDVRWQPWLYSLLGFALTTVTASMLAFTGLFRTRTMVLAAPVVLGLVAINHVFHYITLTYQIYTAVIALLCLMFMAPPQSAAARFVLMTAMVVLAWSGPYSVLAIPVGAALLMSFGGGSTTVRTVLVIGAVLAYFLTVEGGTTRTDMATDPLTLAYARFLLFHEVLTLDLVESVTPPLEAAIVVSLAVVLTWLRQDRVYVMVALTWLALTVLSLAPFLLSVKFLLYGHALPCHVVIGQFFWIAFLLLTIDRIIARCRERALMVVPAGAALAGLVAIDSLAHPDKRSTPILTEIPLFLETARHVERLALERDDAFTVLHAQSDAVPAYLVHIRIGSRASGARRLDLAELPGVPHPRFVSDSGLLPATASPAPETPALPLPDGGTASDER